ncbi:MAG: ABC transporter ATP-binding protein [Gammaproteobacteria bacterium]
MPDATIAASARGLAKTFDNGAAVHALRGVDLDVRYGELTMLVGPSGCGKTTLLCVLAGLLDKTAGEVEILGTRVADLPERERVHFRRRNLGFVFQQFNLLPALTAAENVAVPLIASGIARARATERACELLERLGMADRSGALPRQLSGGQQQRVALARAVIHAPRLIVCDEPTSALDANTGHRVMELLTEVSLRPDRAVIVVTHDSRIFDFADAIAHMEDGRIDAVRRHGAPARRPAAAPAD